MKKKNPSIVKNTFLVYTRIFLNISVSLITTRFVLQELGQSDYGLYAVVAGLIAMLNVISIAMTTTTRRFINVEMGKPDGNLNKIFNISMVLHTLFAIFIFIVAESIGIFYINNFLNVASDKLTDANFIFQISTIVAAIGIINVPYQALLVAYERFDVIVIIDILLSAFKIFIVVSLVLFDGNDLLLYSVLMCCYSLLSFTMNSLYCRKSWKNVVKYKFYKDKDTYKKILVFNNYTALGAACSIGRSQGSTLLINYFFGTIINGAFAIAKQIENFIRFFVSNLGVASGPRITQSYAAGDIEKATILTGKVNKYSILVMFLIFAIVFVELDFFIKLWLSRVPEGAIILCKWTLISALAGSFAEGIPVFIAATGKIKWFQIIGSFISLIVLPISYFLYRLSFPPETILISYLVVDFIYKIISFYLLYKLVNFNVKEFVIKSYLPVLKVMCVVGIYLIIYSMIDLCTVTYKLFGLTTTIIFTTYVTFKLGLDVTEKDYVTATIKKRLKWKK